MNAGPERTPPRAGNPPRSRPVQPSWRGAFHGVWTLTWKSQSALGRLPLLAVTLLLIPALLYFTIEDENVEVFLRWTIDFYLLLLLPLYCLSVCGGMIRDELQADTFGFLATRPVSRARLFLTKYLCHLIWLQGLAALHGGLLVAAGLARHVPAMGSLGFSLLTTQILAVVAYSALSALLGLLHQRYMVLGIIYGFIVEMGIGRIPTNINNLSLSRHLRTILGNQPAIHEHYEWSADGTASSIVIMAAATVVFLGLAALTFTIKEYHAAEEMHK